MRFYYDKPSAARISYEDLTKEMWDPAVSASLSEELKQSLAKPNFVGGKKFFTKLF